VIPRCLVAYIPLEALPDVEPEAEPEVPVEPVAISPVVPVVDSPVVPIVPVVPVAEPLVASLNVPDVFEAAVFEAVVSEPTFEAVVESFDAAPVNWTELAVTFAPEPSLSIRTRLPTWTSCNDWASPAKLASFTLTFTV
jgi:hypothetical protein